MGKCEAQCNRSQIGPWYDLVLTYLNTSNFVVRPVRTQGKTVYDVKLRPSAHLDLTQLSNPSLTDFRLRAEQKLHQLYVQIGRQMYPDSNVSEYIPSMFMSFRLGSRGWEWFCEADTMRLGLCELDPVPLLGMLLQDSIQTGTRLFQGSCLIPVHLNLTLETGGLEIQTHAMTLLVNTRCQTVWLFDPQGSLATSSFPSGQALDQSLLRMLRQVCQKINYQSKGYLCPRCNFQTDNPVYCYIWTSWVELLAVLNPWMTPRSLGAYLSSRHRHFHRENLKRQTAIQFGHYLREIDRENT